MKYHKTYRDVFRSSTSLKRKKIIWRKRFSVLSCSLKFLSWDISCVNFANWLNKFIKKRCLLLKAPGYIWQCVRIPKMVPPLVVKLNQNWLLNKSQHWHFEIWTNIGKTRVNYSQILILMETNFSWTRLNVCLLVIACCVLYVYVIGWSCMCVSRMLCWSIRSIAICCTLFSLHSFPSFYLCSLCRDYLFMSSLSQICTFNVFIIHCVIVWSICCC